MKSYQFLSSNKPRKVPTIQQSRNPTPGRVPKQRKRTKEPSFCQFTWQTGRHQAVERQDILLVPCQPQTLPLAYTQGGGMQHLQKDAKGTRQIQQ